ncbi:unnamed protein product [Ranitomeya imitator]|uniref:Nuclear receptor-interacting protein 3 n=1 Tax=Ranitomeya imitator TaxID=111125 RepID=A0ABN9KRD1_9NEOB|nr:unnamed protein product [Ranitomeya imitator]
MCREQSRTSPGTVTPRNTVIKHDRSILAAEGSIAQGGGSLCASLRPSVQRDEIALKEHFRSYKKEEEILSLPYNVKSIGQVDRVTVTLGHMSLDCSAAVIDDKERNFSLGLQALRSLKCVINLEKNHLEVGRADREVVPFIASRSAAKEECSLDAYEDGIKDNPHFSHPPCRRLPAEPVMP